jgi:hypothetical protein
LRFFLFFFVLTAQEDSDGAILHPSLAGQDEIQQDEMAGGCQRARPAKVPEGLEGPQAG